VGRWVKDVPREWNIRDAHWTMQSPSIHSSLTPTNPTALLSMSSVTFFKSSDCENSQQFWEGASSGPATQSPRRECYPSTCPVFARLDTPTPTGSACKGIPQTCRPQRHAPMTLGTRTQIPTRHMLDTLGVQTTSDSNVPSGQKLGLLKMYP